MDTMLLASDPSARLHFQEVLSLVTPLLRERERAVLDFVLSGNCSDLSDLADHLSLSKERARLILEDVLTKVRRVTDFHPRFHSWSDIVTRRRRIAAAAHQREQLEAERRARAAEYERRRVAKFDNITSFLLSALTPSEIVVVSTTLPEPFATSLLSRLALKA